MKSKIELIPNTSAKQSNIIGKNIQSFIPEIIVRDKRLILIVSPECSYCHKAIESILASQIDIPLTLVEYRNTKESFLPYIEQHKNKDIEYYNVNENQLKKMHINVFPSYLIVNSQGVIMFNPATLQHSINSIKFM